MSRGRRAPQRCNPPAFIAMNAQQILGNRLRCRVGLQERESRWRTVVQILAQEVTYRDRIRRRHPAEALRRLQDGAHNDHRQPVGGTHREPLSARLRFQRLLSDQCFRRRGMAGRVSSRDARCQRTHHYKHKEDTTNPASRGIQII